MIRLIKEFSAYSNIALIKYWGKRDNLLNLPTKSSVSLGLGSLKTTTKVKISDSDRIFINDIVLSDNESIIKIMRFLHIFRRRYGISDFFEINSSNNFPTSAGLASSASGFAALAKALNFVCNLNLDSKELSILARLGSGSACRSIQGGFCYWSKGDLLDGSDSYSKQMFNSEYWPELRIIVVIVNSEKKKVSSSHAMAVTVKTCKIYKSWVINSEKRIKSIINAITFRDFEAFGQLAQIDCLDMHETMRNSSPSINYPVHSTYGVINLVELLRRSGEQCYFTIDAGPNVKILTLEKHLDAVLKKLRELDGIEKIIVSEVAPDEE